jgi:lysophospholipase L1-like esterase
MAVMRRPAALAGLTGQHGVLFEGVGEDPNVFPQFENSGRPSRTNSVILQNSGGTEPYRGYDYSTLGWTHVAIKWSNSVAQVYINGRLVYSASASSSPLVLRNLRVGTYSSTPHGYEYAALALYQADLSASDIATAAQVMSARAVAAGITMGSVPQIVIHDGDSITAEQDYCFGWKTVPGLTKFSIAAVYSSGGAVIGTLNLRLQYLLDSIASIIALGQTPVVTFLLGANDLTSESAASFITKVQTWATAIRGAGAKLVINTVLPRTTNLNSGVIDTTFNGKRTTVNAAYRTWVGTYCDALIDHDTEAYGADAACIDTGMYYDGWHPTSATQATMTSKTITAVNALQ